MDDNPEPMKVVAPPGLRYPITVTDLLVKRGEKVVRSQPLFSYYFETLVVEDDRWGKSKEVKRKIFASYEAHVEGDVAKWHITPHSVVAKPGILLCEINEPCTHEIQFFGMCAVCGRNMTEVDYLTKEPDRNRAPVSMDVNPDLRVSRNEARKSEEESKTRLLKARKLTLIVDLDQTVIHTTCERTIADWQADPDNPNHEFVKDVQGFQLADDNVANVAANWYYVKMRPGLKGFFDRMSQLYEMHIYTMATRAYAEAVAKIIDPDRKYFGDRILSRDENGTDKSKNLHRLFPNNTDMVVIIDDRADIWQYSDHLVRVPVFNFFPGAGDINASFLPKQQELVTTPRKKSEPKIEPKGEAISEARDEDALAAYSVAGKPLKPLPAKPINGVKNELEQSMLTMGAAESQEDLEEQVKEREKVIVAQQTERPLLQQQLTLEKEEDEEEAERSESPENGDSQSTEHHKHRAILNNDDRGLEVVEKNLRRVYEAFYEEYQRSIVVPKGSRVAELKGEKSPKKPRLDGIVPDIADLMPRIKSETLATCVIVFSGIIPLGMDVETSDFALWIKSFGAEISLNVDRRTTHVIANPDRKTSKVKKAARILHEGGNIQIVTAEWMFQCCTRWEHVDEEPYYIDVEDERSSPAPVEELEEESVDATEDEDARSPILDVGDDDWAAMHKEMEELENESDSDVDSSRDSDSESVRSTESTQADANGAKPVKRKRKRGTESAEEADDSSDSSVESTSRLQKRKKRTMERVTSLTNVMTADKESSGLPSPETTGPEEEQGDEFDPKGGGPDLAEDNDQDFEKDLLAEFEAGFEEE